MISRTKFEIAYEGPAVEGAMDVRELAPALLALGDLIESANRVIGDPETHIKVVVRSSFEKGSFQITLELIQTITEQIKLFLEFQNTNAPSIKILTCIGFVAGSGISLLKLIKHLRGRPIKKATILENGNVRLELEGENGQFEYIEVDEKVIRLYRDISVRQNLQKVLSPLEKEGIDGFSVRKNKEVIEKISKDEYDYYRAPDASGGEETNTHTRRCFVNIIEVAFEKGLKWRFSDGESKFAAIVDDKEFLEQVERGKKFAKGDVLEVELETTQVVTPFGIRNEHRVVKVFSHKSRPQQLSLPFDK